MNQPKLTPNRSVCVYNHHDKFLYEFSISGEDYVVRKRSRHEEWSELIKSYHVHVGRGVILEARCHPKENKLYIVLKSRTGSRFHFLEYDVSKNFLLWMTSCPFDEYYVMIIENDRMLVLARSNIIVVFELCLENGHKTEHQLGLANRSHVFTKRFDDGTEKIFAAHFMSDGTPYPGLCMFDTKSLSWKMILNIDMSNIRNSFECMFVDLDNDTVCMAVKDTSKIYTYSFTTNKWTCLDQIEALESIFHFPGSNILHVECQSSQHFIFVHPPKKVRNEKLFLQCETIPSFLLGDVNADLLKTYSKAQTQIKQYFCGLDVIIETLEQLNAFTRFAVETADSNLIGYAIHLLRKFYSTHKHQNMSLMIWVIDRLNKLGPVIKQSKKVAFFERFIVQAHTSTNYDFGSDYDSYREFDYRHPRHVFDEKLIKMADSKDCDWVLVVGEERIPVHSAIMKMSSGYFEALDSFHCGAVREIDLSEMIEPELFHPFIQFMHDKTKCRSWDFDLVVKMMCVTDSICCDTMFDQLVYHIARDLKTDQLIQVAGLCSMFEKCNSILGECCRILQNKSPNNFESL
jgi:hypothetical protein